MKNLTNYDKYMLEKRQRVAAEATQTEVNGSVSNEYDDYLINELRRTAPSDRKVMSEAEFYESRKETVSGTKAVAVKKESEHRFHLRKSGKIFLIIYVILMVALASILIVSNTARDATFEGISFNQSAGAASADENSENTVRPMTVEEETTDETNWFDRLCDSLNK